MSTYSATVPVVSTNADFQTIATAIDSQIRGFGFTQSSDTGQITPASVSKPSSGTYAGFLMYQTNDGLTTVYTRLDLGVSAAGALIMKMQSGYSTDGAGTLGSQKTTQAVLNPAGTPTTPLLNMAGSGGSWFTIVYAVNNAFAACWACGFEREKDTTAADVATGFNIMYANNASNFTGQEYVPSSGTLPGPFVVGIVCAQPFNTTTGVVGANTIVSPSLPVKETGAGNAALAVLVYTGSNFTANTSTVANLYGSNHTYLVTPIANAFVNNSNFKTMWRYE